MLSFTGAIHRRSGSGSSPTVEDLTESPKEKASHRVTSKADPTKAMNEAQPGIYYQQVNVLTSQWR